MANKVNKERLQKHIAQEKSKWLEQADYYDNNKEWLDKSALIAIKILSTLRCQSKTQRDLAESIGVTPQYINKVVKGNENLSLETICKIERSLGIALITVPEYESTQVIADSFTPIPFAIPRYESKPIGSEKTDYESECKYNEQEGPIAA